MVCLFAFLVIPSVQPKKRGLCVSPLKAAEKKRGGNRRPDPILFRLGMLKKKKGYVHSEKGTRSKLTWY